MDAPVVPATTSTLPRAFLVQENPKHDYIPLREFAQWPPLLVFGQGQVTLEPEAAVARARARLAGICRDDYLVLNGDPVMIGICFSVVRELLGVVRALRWDRRELTYVPIDLTFDPTPPTDSGKENSSHA